MKKEEDVGKSLVGSWVQALGTILAAVGSTPSLVEQEELERDFGLVGNVLQATGNGLEVDSQEDWDFGSYGGIIQATGNLTVTTAYIKDVSEVTEIKLFITGNLLQALGAVTALESVEEAYEVVGFYLQAIGNSLQALGDSRRLKIDDTIFMSNPDVIVAVGSWIQTIGTILLALGKTYEWTNKSPD
ncbi:hypothetical protein FIU87_17080 [Bacillus sp. THAF10]|uniref:DUF6944 family repetitive protein n=1 Tax=Bacillus sp. THAF10 TaxID=2587848 RepID=UPI001268BB44|nr:hypothetical protein [Bacillus sp. THAF10]QFT90356.1 hypothetical protein FIU87_17080 [Bacillus sp. THAF10]